MSGELLYCFTSGFQVGLAVKDVHGDGYVNYKPETKYGVGHPDSVSARSYYSLIFNDAYKLTIYGGTGTSYTASNSLIVADNDTTIEYVGLTDLHLYNITAGRFENYGGDDTVSFSYRSFSARTFIYTPASTGRKLRICNNFSVTAASGTAATYASATLMTTAHYILCV